MVSYGINYDGSPVSEGRYRHEENGFVEPVYYWDPVIAPGGMVFYDGAAFPDWEGDLLDRRARRWRDRAARDGGDRVTGEERLLTDLGRVRDVAVDADGSVLVITDFEDGSLWRVAPSGAATD